MTRFNNANRWPPERSFAGEVIAPQTAKFGIESEEGRKEWRHLYAMSIFFINELEKYGRNMAVKGEHIHGASQIS